MSDHSENYVKINSDNLPKVGADMVMNFMKGKKNLELQGFSKENMLSKKIECTGFQIGYVYVKRDKNFCYLRAKATRGSETDTAFYSLTMVVNEKQRSIIGLTCRECSTMVTGDCIHSAQFLLWTHQKSQELQEAQVLTNICAKSSLNNALKLKQHVNIPTGALSVNKQPSKQEIPAKALLSKRVIAPTQHCQTNLQQFFTNKSGVQVKNFTMPKLVADFLKTGKSTAEDFLHFTRTVMNKTVIEEVERATRTQRSDLWLDLRKGRITGSKVHELAHCRTHNGNLVDVVLGIANKFQSNAMKRGIKLEDKILEVVRRREGLQFQNVGLKLSSQMPIIGASPDAVGSDFIVEVKAPSSLSGYERFLPKGEIGKQYKHQMYLEMLCTKKKRGIFCVADPNFERNKKVTTVWLTYDDEFATTVLQKAITFWKEAIFPRLMNPL